MSFSFQCDICQDDFPLDGFLFYQCGHGYCESCTSKNKQITCPMCRRRRNHEPIKVYLTPAATTVEEKAMLVGRAMDAIGPDSSEGSTKNIVKKLRSVTEELNVDEATASRLLDAANHFEERLNDLFYRLRLEQDEKRALQEKVNLWLPRVQITDKLGREVKCLKRTLHEAKQEMADALVANSELRNQLEAKDRENAKLKQMIAEQTGIINVKDSEIAQWKKTAEDEGKQARLYKKKMKAMSKGLPQRQSDEGNQSLVVAAPGVPFTETRSRDRLAGKQSAHQWR